jgi:hypothetical protein
MNDLKRLSMLPKMINYIVFTNDDIGNVISVTSTVNALSNTVYEICKLM